MTNPTTAMGTSPVTYSDEDGASAASGTALSSLRDQAPTGLAPDGLQSHDAALDAAISTYGTRAKARRLALGLTLEQVAERAGLAKSYVWEVENAKKLSPSIRTTWHLARALGWSLSEMIGVWEHQDLLCEDAMRIAVQIDMAIRKASVRADIVLAEPPAANDDLLEALQLADALLRGANMNRTVVERKVAAAIAKAQGEA